MPNRPPTPEEQQTALIFVVMALSVVLTVTIFAWYLVITIR